MPGMYGLEAGQSAVGDIFNWFVKYLTPAAYTAKGDPHAKLTREAERLRPGESGLAGPRLEQRQPHDPGRSAARAACWSGKRCTRPPPEVYRALVEATAFGALTIINRLEEYGVAVKEVVNCGGIAEKNPFVMQIYADVCNRPMKISRSSQTCALGAAMFGAVAGGAFKAVQRAQQKMTGFKDHVYRPNRAAAKTYVELYRLYHRLHDAFGTPEGNGQLHGVMKDLIALRERVRREDR